MASNIILLFGAFITLTAALLAPCLPSLGPEFCPGTSAAASHQPKFPLKPVAFPARMYQEKVVRHQLFPSLNKTSMDKSLRLYAGNDSGPEWWEHPNRHCWSEHGLDTGDTIDTDTMLLMYVEVAPMPFYSFRLYYPDSFEIAAGDTVVC